MTARVARTAKAEADLLEILTFISRDNPAAARRLLDRLDDRAALLAAFPGIGRAHPRRSLRLFPVGDYLIVYREKSSGIEIVRYLHGRRDLDRLI